MTADILTKGLPVQQFIKLRQIRSYQTVHVQVRRSVGIYLTCDPLITLWLHNSL